MLEWTLLFLFACTSFLFVYLFILMNKDVCCCCRTVDDMDLFPAAIAERRVEGGLVGPTFACLLARQFSDLRRGDRYWYENSGPFRFSQGTQYS